MKQRAPIGRRAFLAGLPLACLGLVGCGGCAKGRLSERNFDRVEVGMTEEEVERLLGRPNESQMTAGESAKTTMLWKNEDGERAAIVFFENGNVVRKGSKGLK